MSWRKKGSNSKKLVTMSKRVNPTPVSSDEGAESGDDSEEDLVTNYIQQPGHGGANPSNHPPPHHPQPPPPHHRRSQPQQQQQQSHSNTWGESVHPPQHLPLRSGHAPPLQTNMTNVSRNDQAGVLPAHSHGYGQPRRLMRMAEIPTMDSMTAESLGMGSDTGYVPPIPTIHITPYSPISPKPFTVLDESIKQLQGLQEKVQRMREDAKEDPKKNGRGLNRLSSSCPSLNVDGDDPDEDDSPSWSEEFLLDTRRCQRTAGGLGGMDQIRRRSWSGLSDEEQKRNRQRSISLSSLDSDTEEPFYDASEKGTTDAQGVGSPTRSGDKQRSLSGSSSSTVYGRKDTQSTHSLNEQAKNACVPVPVSKGTRLLAPRLTLQKSISTPSILAGVQAQQQQEQPNTLSYPYDDDPSTSKPRKRGSIFFRKKKDKSKHHHKTSHQFVGVCYSNSATCDVCGKPMTNKPALRCEMCLVCVHENSCKEQISDCSKLKNSKSSHKPSSASSSSLSNSTKSSSLGSAPCAPAHGGSTQLFASNSQQGRSRGALHAATSPTRPSGQGLQAGKLTNEDKDQEGAAHESQDPNILDVNSASMESLEDSSESQHPTPSTAHSSSVVSEAHALETIDVDPFLRLFEEEPDLWEHTVDKEFVKDFSPTEKKRQEAIHELIKTEKNHCSILKVMSKVYAEGMSKELIIKEATIKAIFPCLDELIVLHFSFLWRLRHRQSQHPAVDSIGDLLVEQFIGDNARGLKEVYSLFCSNHNNAVHQYKELLKTHRNFQSYVRSRSEIPVMRKKGIPEAMLFATQRVNKYPLLIVELLKYCKDMPQETEKLNAALGYVKDILNNINDQVAEIQNKEKLLQIYNKIDAKSHTTYKDQKFKKSDLLADWRKLVFYGNAYLYPQRGKLIQVMVVVMSDLVFFLQENNQKYQFMEGKACAIPLAPLIVRTKAARSDHNNTSSIFFISPSNTLEKPEMLELECIFPKETKGWIDSIVKAKEKCLEFSSEMERKLNEPNADRIQEIILAMQHCDKEFVRVCDHKMSLVFEITNSLASETLPHPVDYEALLGKDMDPEASWTLQIQYLNEALRLVSGASGWGSNLARSVSSVGEHQSSTYVSPVLPKRAETFGGFDNPQKDGTAQSTNGGSKQSLNKKNKKESKLSLVEPAEQQSTPIMDTARRLSACMLFVTPAKTQTQDSASVVSNASDDSNQQQTLAQQLVHYLQTAMVLSQHHMTQYLLLRAQVQNPPSTPSSNLEETYNHSQKLEELRNLQEQISQERTMWTRERDHHDKWIQDKKDELKKREEMVKNQQDDVNQQREDLYRKLEALKSQGIVLNPTLMVLTSGANVISGVFSPGTTDSVAVVDSPTQPYMSSPHTSPTAATQPTRVSSSRLDSKHRNSTASLSGHKREPQLPTHLISAANQQKVQILVEQQLPMKLAKLGTASSGSSTSSSTGGSLSSMSMGSLGGSTGGSMSPSQDQQRFGAQQVLPLKLSELASSEPKPAPRYSGGYTRLASPPPDTGQANTGSTSHYVSQTQDPQSRSGQMLPFKLSEMSTTSSNAEPKKPRHSGGYAMLTSPDNSNTNIEGSSSHDNSSSVHQRTGSSPATLQNGAHATAIQRVEPNQNPTQTTSSGGNRALRTHTYPKLPARPANFKSKPIAQHSSSSTTTPDSHHTAPQPGMVPSTVPSNPAQTGPGQRMKDPDSNQDILFF